MEVQGVSSESKALACGMPQGSKSGPRKYTEPLGQLLVLRLMLYHFYADDTQVMKSANPQCSVSILNVVDALERAIAKDAK